MPLIIPKTLPAYDALYAENIFVMHRERALSQHIRPLEIAILNLMPTKIATETQIARLLANSPLQVHMTLLQTDSHAHTHDFPAPLDTLSPPPTHHPPAHPVSPPPSGSFFQPLCRGAVPPL